MSEPLPETRPAWRRFFELELLDNRYPALHGLRVLAILAVVQLRSGREPTDDDLRATAAEHIARYKLPKAVVRVPVVERSPSGKPDYGWAARVAAS